MFWLMYFTFGVFAMTDLWYKSSEWALKKCSRAVQKKNENQLLFLMRTILCGNMTLPKDYWHGWSIEN